MLDQRIDFILVRDEEGRSDESILESVFAIVVGDELEDRTPSGLWPSDHAGVVARLIAEEPEEEDEADDVDERDDDIR